MIDKAALIAELVELTSVPLIDPVRDLTAQELAPHFHCDPTNVSRKMEPWVARGLYGTAIKVHPETSRRHRVWWKIESEPDECGDTP